LRIISGVVLMIVRGKEKDAMSCKGREGRHSGEVGREYSGEDGREWNRKGCRCADGESTEAHGLYV